MATPKRPPPRRSTRKTHFVHPFEKDPDPYLERRKVAGSATCPDCNAVHSRGKWSWRAKPKSAIEHVCPACQRIRDKVPAAYLTLVDSDFLRAHETEILHLIAHVEAHEREEHPLKREMGRERTTRGLEITFTDSHLARAIAEALHHAYQGNVDLQYTPGDVMLRATWNR
jgi:NMD protein affecting ribosome stability and mRNA decay